MHKNFYIFYKSTVDENVNTYRAHVNPNKCEFLTSNTAFSLVLQTYTSVTLKHSSVLFLKESKEINKANTENYVLKKRQACEISV